MKIIEVIYMAIAKIKPKCTKVSFIFLYTRGAVSSSWFWNVCQAKSDDLRSKCSKFHASNIDSNIQVKVSGMHICNSCTVRFLLCRVQRVPVTGSKNDRLQTSTCSVAILPKQR